MEWFEANDLIERHPAIAVHGALQFAVAVGRPPGRTLGGAAERSSPTGRLTDGSTIEG